MANVHVFGTAPILTYETFQLVEANASSFRVRGMQTGTFLTFFGDGFYYENDDLAGGMITGYELSGGDGTLFQRITGLDLRIDQSTDPDSVRDQLMLRGSDQVWGSAGNDTLDGLEGADLVNGMDGDDLLRSQDGWPDTLVGGAGNDRYQAGPSDVVVEAPGGGFDTIVITYELTGYPTYPVYHPYVLPAEIEGIEVSGHAWNIYGNAMDNRLAARTSLMRMEGREGNDTLSSTADDVTLVGGTGDDTYALTGTTYHWPNPAIVEEANGGTDTLLVTDMRTVWLHAELENMTLVRTLKGIGNAKDNLLRVSGNSGTELDGGAGADTLIGGTGNDILHVDDLLDVAIPGAGADTLFTAVSGMQLPPGFVAMQLEHGASLGYGTPGGDRIVANLLHDSTVHGFAGNDTLLGYIMSNDTLEGSFRADLLGGEGDDVLHSSTGGGLLEGESGWDRAILNVGFQSYAVTRSGSDVLVSRYLNHDTTVPWFTLRGIEEVTFVGYHSKQVLNPHLVQGSVAIGGAAAAGSTLASAQSLRDDDTLGAFSYQWMRGAEPIEGAVADAYTLTAADTGTDIRLRVQFADGLGNLETAWSQVFPTTATLGSSAGADRLQGISAAESLTAQAGDDTVMGAGGNDTIDAGEGTDTVGFAGLLSEYQLTREAGALVVADSFALRDGTDQVRAAEILRFADRNIDLGAQAHAQKISAADLKLLSELYVGFFNRIPEAQGLAYWIDRRAEGWSFETIAQRFFEAGVTFGLYNDQGFYSTMVQEVYANVLARPSNGPNAPTGPEIQYWVDWMQTHQPQEPGAFPLWANAGPMVVRMLDDVHTWFTDHPTVGFVADLLDNKAALAYHYAVELGLGHNLPADSIAFGQALAQWVTPTDIGAAIAFIGIDPIAAA